MSPYIALAIIPVLGIICYEDFKSRHISVVWAAVLLVLSAFTAGQHISAIDVFIRIIVNTTLATIILLSGTLMVKLRKPGLAPGNIIGTGDFLFLGSISPLFRFELFLVFLNFSLLLVLLSSLVYNILCRRKLQTIPLAGGISAVSLILLSLEFTIETDLLAHLNVFLLTVE